MAYTFTMPKLGHLMEEGTVVSWHKRIGEHIEKGDILLEVLNDKAAIEVESPMHGVLLKILVEPDLIVPVGTPLAIIGESGETV